MVQEKSVLVSTLQQFRQGRGSELARLASGGVDRLASPSGIQHGVVSHRTVQGVQLLKDCAGVQ